MANPSSSVLACVGIVSIVISLPLNQDKEYGKSKQYSALFAALNDGDELPFLRLSPMDNLKLHQPGDHPDYQVNGRMSYYAPSPGQ